MESVWINPLSASDEPPEINLNTRPGNHVDTSLLWHRRMGHLSLRNIKRLLKFKAADGIPSIKFDRIGICHPCSVAKSQHRPFQGISRQMVQGPGDVIIADLMGPLPPSLDRKKYVLTIQDCFSRLTVAIPLLDKTEAKVELQQWILQFMNTTGYKVKIVRTDNGSEFKNMIFNDFLKQQGILHEYSMPYEHHQNGKIERTNQTISEMARTSLNGANLPITLWPWAYRHAVWIFNRTLHADSTKTPYEIVAKRKPSLDMLKVFGSKAFLYTHNFRKGLSDRATVGFHLGVAQDSKGWIFWIPEKRQIARAASVKFDELSTYRGDCGNIGEIQAKELFDGSMIDEIQKQDRMVNQMSKQHDLLNSMPTSYKDAMNSHESNNWSHAIKEELGSMAQENVFEITSLKDALAKVPHESICSTKWVFVKKDKPQRYKARLVARGFRQIHGINYEETFAPTPTFGALRLLFSTACLNSWEVRTFDVKVAFLHSIIDKPVFIWPPQGMCIPKFNVFKLKKALYGTKQAARCWWLHLKEILTNIGFKSNSEDPSTYTYKGSRGEAILWIHVDNGALTTSSAGLMEWISGELDKQLKIKWDSEITGLVGISIVNMGNGFKFSQPDLIDKVISLKSSNVMARSPLPINCNLKSNPLTVMDKVYLKYIGMMLYISQGTCPDIAYAVNYLARFSMGTDDTHWQALEHLVAYLRYTKMLGIFISTTNSSREMKCYVDANWGGEGDRSTHGFILFQGSNPICWQLKRQATIASSTAQAEYMALSFAAKECLWMSNLFYMTLGNITLQLLSDNKTAIGISTESMSRKQTRHLVRDFNIINEYIIMKKLTLSWISTKNQLADIMTKALGYINVKSFVDIVMIE
ncbi:hypothetical protein O181_081163 [Austropuccinia psidii MF-1]|uniref:Integrase catalytic domain-containing protein n=1 Tax=Austropuccinia psidii MF-1 TaxID=1389203 RepID=A0A9Q3IH69_9BASI|nr:hypothetical protein [Austropuccinia psidii MF-1]